MTQKEFENLTGKAVTANEYAEIEKVYMVDDNMDKVEFCEMWKKATPASRSYMIKMAVEKEKENLRVRYLNEQIENYNDIMFQRTQAMSDPILRKVCIKYLGAKQYITRMIDGGYPLWDDDKKLIKDLLSE